MQLVIGNKNYSSWSMRPWVLMRHFDIAFSEHRVLLDQPDTAAQIRAFSPSGRVPCLIDDTGEAIWDSLAIAECLAERYPERHLWPRDPAARARARCIAAEMHSGFGGLRGAMSMNISGRADLGVGHTPEALADIARIIELWSDCLQRFGGPFLCGAFSIADAMYAPVVTRFATYRVSLPPALAAYAERIQALPAIAEWIAQARAEAEAIPKYDALLRA